MSSLPTNLRRQLENAIKQARKTAEGGARKSLEALAVHEPDPYRHMDEAHRNLRRKLRAQARQLGDGESRTKAGAYEIGHLVEKLAYDQWHRLLFARFLLENHLLISPEHAVSVSLNDCEELASSLKLKDAWAVAARFAATELPDIFRGDDPVGAVELPVEDRNPLIQLVTSLPEEVFTASDSLGWCYQFWQSERKEEVNAAGNKIGADELPAVTQLFTEDYMVDFLLDNTLGAWHAGKLLPADPKLAEDAESEDELRQTVALPGCPWKYLRFIKGKDGKWTPAAGTFAGWPKTAKELKCLDPCMGSGHFVVAMFERLVALRQTEEKLDEAAAVAAVIRDNLFGLEIDPRCTQIGAFNLALAAWRRVGHCPLPAMNLACSGLAPNAKQEDWLKLAGDDEKLQKGMERLHQLFKDAPVLGGLINPRAAEGDLLEAAFNELQPLLEEALAQEARDEIQHEMAVTARGLAKAAEIMAGHFALVATNVPYLGRGKQSELLKGYSERAYPEGRADLATSFLQRSLLFCSKDCSIALVTPQNWLFLETYEPLRRKLLMEAEWNIVARLGPGAFETIGGEVVKAQLGVVSRKAAGSDHSLHGIDVSSARRPSEKATLLRGDPSTPIKTVMQSELLKAPGRKITFAATTGNVLLSAFANVHYGSKPGQTARVTPCFWEVTASDSSHWRFMESTPDGRDGYTGKSWVCLTQTQVERQGIVEFGTRGAEAWGRTGVILSQMGSLSCSLYAGQFFDNNTSVLVPKREEHLPALWAFISSPEFPRAVRERNQKVDVDTGSMVSVPFDIEQWHQAAAANHPNGLPKPFSSDPTQWLFKGNPKGSDHPLQVAVARLLSYRWPRQTGSSFPDCPALGPDGLEELADGDGIVCLSATKGEAPGHERLRELLAQAWGKEWSATVLDDLLAQAGYLGKTLDDWLRNGFFEQHCALFHTRPFVWHIWDGHRSGFSALVNYQRLTHANLEKLTYAYLGDWIRRQQTSVDAGEAGSDARLQASKQLQSCLRLILEGEPPYDLFVRWKPLSKQAIGWHPDLNDGVRMNIRPFVTADILRKRVKIKWDKDRGKEPVREKKDFPWFWGWDEKKQDFVGVGREPDGNRWNNCHYTNAFKQRARAANATR